MELRQLLKTKKRDKIKESNQFFTPLNIANDLVKASGMTSRYDDISVLEPTAGGGNLIYSVIKARPEANITAVEFDEDNREHLQKLSRMTPTIDVENEPDFMKYIPNKNFDYVIMNPPFNIKIDNKKFLDIDFILRAYAMLKEGGVLVAIASTHFTFARDAVQRKDILEKLGGTYTPITKKWRGEVGEIADDMKTDVNVVMVKITKNSYKYDNLLLERNYDAIDI